MTPVEVRYQLQSRLTGKQTRRLASLPSTYGIRRVQLEDEGRRLVVEYDASRYRLPEVTQILHAAGLPIVEPRSS
jgi:hypothetical protein